MRNPYLGLGCEVAVSKVPSPGLPTEASPETGAAFAIELAARPEALGRSELAGSVGPGAALRRRAPGRKPTRIPSACAGPWGQQRQGPAPGRPVRKSPGGKGWAPLSLPPRQSQPDAACCSTSESSCSACSVRFPGVCGGRPSLFLVLHPHRPSLVFDSSAWVNSGALS